MELDKRFLSAIPIVYTEELFNTGKILVYQDAHTPLRTTPFVLPKYFIGSIITVNRDGLVHSYFDQPAIVTNLYVLCWYKNGKLHRDNGPAYISPTGSMFWYKNGTPHREDGPAVIGQDGSLFWYTFDYYHRSDGPAVIRSDGMREWWKHGVEFLPEFKGNPESFYFTYTEEHFKNRKALVFQYPGEGRTRPYPEPLNSSYIGAKISTTEDRYLHSYNNLPALITSDGKMLWYKKGKLHREDGPAVVSPKGTVIWYIDGIMQKEGGPAMIKWDGFIAFADNEGIKKIIKPDGTIQVI